MGKRAARIAIIIPLSIAILIFGSDALMGKIFYNPLENRQTCAGVFNNTVAALIPSASLHGIATYGFRSYLHYSHYKQSFSVNEISSQRDINHNYLIDGTFEYRFGKMTPNYEVYPEKQIVFSQQHYVQPTAMDSAQLEADQYYLANLAFPETISLWDLEELAWPCFESSSPPLCIRAIMKTSNDDKEVALGIGGHLAYILFDSGTAGELGSRLFQLLEYLAENQRHADVFLQSGMFGDVEVDFSQRLEYVKKNGKLCIGAMVFAKGSYIQEITQDSRCVLVDAFLDA